MKDIPYYQDYISHELQNHLTELSRPVSGVQDLTQIGECAGLETNESLFFLCELYESLKEPLNKVLNQRILDRQFIDSRTKASCALNEFLKVDYLDSNYETIIGQRDSKDRVVVGPLNKFYCRRGVGRQIQKLPEYLKGHHVTLFGPPDDVKLSINAMNAFHRKLKDEPAIVEQLLEHSNEFPKWGADDEDSKTPLREDLMSAGVNLTDCFNREISFTDPDNRKVYHLEESKLSLPIKRFPGLALPSLFLFYKDNPLPLHLYDFALHIFENWHNHEALSFYVPKLETSEEAAYIRLMVATTEKAIKALHPEYEMGSVRLFVVLENPRMIFRTNELMDELFPYFAGASLGWHDYLASTARLFKEDANYRIPVKADPNIVIKYIKASHELLAEVVGSRGGIKIGGMYGILPIDNNLKGNSFQLTIRGYIKDVVTQLKRDLSGFWVAHPDFVRLGLALVEAWKFHKNGDVSKLETLVTELLEQKYHAEILKFIREPDLIGLDLESPLYARALIVADMRESQFIANNHPEEIRYNVFQSLQYLTDWLSGNGCVALPAHIDGVSVRVMDDLATAERSRWEVWHEIYHRRFSLEDFLTIAAEEMLFIRKDLSHPAKIVQVKWSERTEKWYPVAFHLMIQLMTNPKPVEFASELLLPFTVPTIRAQSNPLDALLKIDFKKYRLQEYIEKYNYYFSICADQNFASQMALLVSIDFLKAEELILKLTLKQVIEAAKFHGDIGENKRTLDHLAKLEQKAVELSDDETKISLRKLCDEYLEKFGFKFLVSAQGESATALLGFLKERLQSTSEKEIQNAKNALWKIAEKRLKLGNQHCLEYEMRNLMQKHHIVGAQVSVSTSICNGQNFAFGFSNLKEKQVTTETHFQLASLSKTLASCFAIEFFRRKNIDLSTSVNSLLEQTKSEFRILSLNASHPDWGNRVTITHLMEHTAINMHYVNGISSLGGMPSVRELLRQPNKFEYVQVGVMREPGTEFQYSGGGYLILEHLIESLENKSVIDLTQIFLDEIDANLTFDQNVNNSATGFTDSGRELKKHFPAFAAGAMGSSHGFSQFLAKLTDAFRNTYGASSIAHSTAIQMLFGKDKSSRKFMNADMGLGVFTLQGGPNRFALHQGANDGFRSLFIQCYDGPDQGKGFVILCSGEFNAVLFISEVAQLICRHLNFAGINTAMFPTKFDPKNIRQEEVVNQAYKALIFDAFEPDLPEPISNRVALDPLLDLSVSKNAEILEVSNQGFARAENLFSGFAPVFDPELYGRQGKVMDSWESVRHNQKPFDFIVFKLKKPEVVRFVIASTEYHLGNQAPSIAIEGFDPKSSKWLVLIEKTVLKGHAIHYFKLDNDNQYQIFRISQFPDGGLTRLALFSILNSSQVKCFAQPVVELIENIPQPLKPMTPKFVLTNKLVEANLKKLNSGEEFNIGSLAFGARIAMASNEHYGPAAQIISPYPPLHMFDGFESARSRKPGHSEYVVIQLARPSVLTRIELDFMFFKNNNPFEVEIFGLSGEQWISLLRRTNVKAYAGHIFEMKVETIEMLSQIRINVIPDGGINRVRLFTKA